MRPAAEPGDLTGGEQHQERDDSGHQHPGLAELENPAVAVGPACGVAADLLGFVAVEKARVDRFEPARRDRRSQIDWRREDEICTVEWHCSSSGMRLQSLKTPPAANRAILRREADAKAWRRAIAAQPRGRSAPLCEWRMADAYRSPETRR